MIETFVQDLRYGARMLLKNPGFTGVAALTLALGIGANTAMFSVVNAVLLRPLPYPESERLVEIMRRQRSGNEEAVEASKFLFWRQQSQVFEGMTAFDILGTGFNLTAGGRPDHVTGIRVSADFFRVLGVTPIVGRGFTAEEERPGGASVVVISNRLWKREFGGDPSIKGKTISLSGETYTVVGVMPVGFDPRPSADVWVPLRAPFNLQNDGGPLFVVVGRLKPGTTLKRAQADMERVGQQFRNEFAGFMGKHESVAVVDYHEYLIGDVRPALLVLQGAVGFVLLIACANVANLLLARATVRSKEIAVRTVLGASHMRLLRQLLTESTMLALTASGLGLLLSRWGLHALLLVTVGSLPQFSAVRIDGCVLTFTLLVALVTGIVFGLAPALQPSRIDLNDSLREGGRRTSGSVRSARLRNVLVVAQISLSLVLLVGAVLLIRTLANLRGVNPGFDPHNVLTMKLSLTDSKYGTTAATSDLFRQLVEHTEALPGVEAAAFVTNLPLELGPDQSFQIESRHDNPYGDAQFRAITPNYFRAMKIPLRRGRFFTEADNAQSAGVVIVNEALTRQYFRAEKPIGEHLTITGGAGTGTRKVVGVVADVREEGLGNLPPPTLFIPTAQVSSVFTQLANKVAPVSFVVRTKVASTSLTAGVRKELLAVNSTLAAFSVRPLEELLAGSVARQEFDMLLLGMFAAIALMLAAVGIYGVISYSVTYRANEFGIRVALGAQRTDVLKLVIRQAIIFVVIGLSVGVTVALALTRLMSSLLYGIRPNDPATFVTASVVLAGVALLASYLPAHRATKVDPMVALRYE